MSGFFNALKSSDTDAAVARGFDAVLADKDTAEAREKQRVQKEVDRANQPVGMKPARQKWLAEIARDMETFNMDTTGCPELDKAIEEMNQ